MRKILVDTNILLRYLVDSDEYLEQLASKGVVCLLDEVIIELIFALEVHYSQTRENIFDWIVDLLMKPNCENNRTLIFNTMAVYRERHNLSIVDAYLYSYSELNKIELATYDKKLGKRLIKQ